MVLRMSRSSSISSPFRRKDGPSSVADARAVPFSATVVSLRSRGSRRRIAEETTTTTTTTTSTTTVSPFAPKPRPTDSNDGGGGSSGPSTVDGTLTILVLLTVIFCFVWSPSIIRRCDPRHNERRRRRRAAAAAAAAAEEAALRAVLAGEADDAGRGAPHGMSLEDRREFVANVLVTKKVVRPTDPKDLATSYSIRRKRSNIILPSTTETNGAGKQQRPPPPLLPQSQHPDATTAATPEADAADAETKDGEHNDENEEDAPYNACSICLAEYEEGDEICWSHNTRCNHVFHRECISEWLLRHDECPCCRHNYLSLEDDEDEDGGVDRGDEEAGRAEEGSERETAAAPPPGSDESDDEGDTAIFLRGITRFGLFTTLNRRNSEPSLGSTRGSLSSVEMTRRSVNEGPPVAAAFAAAEEEGTTASSGPEEGSERGRVGGAVAAESGRRS